MEDNFKIEIISPEKIIFSDSAKMIKIPSYEGDMSILKDHISIITFLRPGIVKVEKKDNDFEEFLDNLSKETEKELSKENITDQDRYILNHKIDTIKEIRI